MKKLMYFYDNCKTSIKIAFLGVILLSFGYFFLSSSVNTFYSFSNSLFVSFSKVSFKVGQAIILNLPLIIMINFVCKRANSGTPIALALVGYFVYLISTILLSNGKLDSYVYASNVGINSIFNLGDFTIYPFETGLIGSAIVAIIVRFSFLKATTRSNNSVFYFISNETMAFIYTIILCFIAGTIISFITPYIYSFFKLGLTYISNNSSNPYIFGLYGVADRICSILGIGSVIKTPFWTTSLGGSYIDTLTGTVINGDVNLWNYVTSNSITIFGAGKYTSYYYIVNMFISPAIYFAYMHTINDKNSKTKYRLLFIAGSLLSIICGNPLPLELLLIITAPAILLIYLVFVYFSGVAICYLSSYIGFEYIGGNVNTAMPGNLFDLLVNLRTTYLDSVNKILIIGVICLILVYILCRLYFRYLSYDIFNNSSDKLCDEMIMALGGKDNIDTVSTDYLKLLLYVKEKEYINYDDIRKLDIKTIKEGNDYISFDVGVSNYKLYKIIKSKIKK